MVNDKTHLYGPEDANKDRKNTEKRRDQQQFSRFSAAVSSALNTAGLEPKAPATQIDTKVQIGDPYDDTKGSVSLSTQIVSFNVYGSNYTFYEVTGDVDFAFNELPTGRHITFTLDILVNQAAGVTIGFPTVTNPPVLAGNDGDRYVLEFIAVNRTDPTGVNPPVQTITFLGEGTSGAVSFPLTPDISAKGNVTGTVDIDLSAITAHYQEMRLIGNITFTFSNPPADNKEISFLIDMTQDATGGRIVTWPASVRVDPTVGSGANARTVIIVTTVDNGINYDALIVTGGTVNAANKTLSNLVSPLSINQDLLFSTTGFDLGNSTNPLDNLFVNQIRLQTGILGTNIPNIVSEDGNQMTFNVDTAQIFLWKIAAVTKMTMSSSVLNLNSVMQISNATGMTYSNAGFDPIVNGEFRLNGTDMKVFSGGAVRNLSDIVAGGGNEFQDSLFRIIDNLDNTKKLAFQVSGLTTATTRTITIPDANFTLGGLGLNQTWSGVNTFSSQINLNGDISGSGSLARDLIPDSDGTRVLGNGSFRYAAISTIIVRFNTSTQFITADTAGIRFEIPTADVFNWEINNVDELTLTNTALNVHSNDIINTGNILSTSGNVDVGDSTGFDAFFGRRIEFPNVLGVATAANREIISTTVLGTNTIKMNLPLNEDFMITENNVTVPTAFLLDTSAGQLTLDNPIFTFRINASSVFAITKFDSGIAQFNSDAGFSFSDIVKILTPAGQTALELDGVDGTPDVGLINTPANVDFEYSAGGTNKMRFDASVNEFQFNADIVRIQERLNVKETTITPPTPPAGQCTLFLFDDGGAEPNNSLRVKFDNGNVQTIATEV